MHENEHGIPSSSGQLPDSNIFHLPLRDFDSVAIITYQSAFDKMTCPSGSKRCTRASLGYGAESRDCAAGDLSSNDGDGVRTP